MGVIQPTAEARSQSRASVTSSAPQPAMSSLGQSRPSCSHSSGPVAVVERRLAELPSTPEAPVLSWVAVLLALFMLVLFYVVLKRFGFSKPKRQPLHVVASLSEVVIVPHGKRN